MTMSQTHSRGHSIRQGMIVDGLQRVVQCELEAAIVGRIMIRIRRRRIRIRIERL